MLRLVTVLSLLIATAFAGPLASSWEGRIVGGQNATIGQFPYQVSMRSQFGGHFCGGAIISANWVVCAAHCTVGRTTANTRVVAGTNDVSGGTLLPVSRIVNHPQYNRFTLNFDISLVQTASPMVFTNTLQSIKIARSHIGGGLRAIASGWGRTSSGNAVVPRNLQFVELETITNERCRSMLSASQANNIHNSTICSFIGTGRGTCFGDSGGPLTVNNELVGAVSWGVPCAVGRPDMYARVDYAAGWITNVTGIAN